MPAVLFADVTALPEKVLLPARIQVPAPFLVRTGTIWPKLGVLRLPLMMLLPVLLPARISLAGREALMLPVIAPVKLSVTLLSVALLLKVYWILVELT